MLPPKDTPLARIATIQSIANRISVGATSVAFGSSIRNSNALWTYHASVVARSAQDPWTVKLEEKLQKYILDNSITFQG
jgi:hypothetical protein